MRLLLTLMLRGLLMITWRVGGEHSLKPGSVTRSRPISNSIDAKLRDDFSQLKHEIIKWGELACSIPQTMDVIEIKHKAFLGNIDLKISEVLVTKGDLVLVGELGNLKDRLNWIRKRAKQVSREPADLPQQQDDHIPVQEPEEEYCNMMVRSCDLDYVFQNEEPIERSSPYSIASTPIYRGGGTQGEPSSNGAMVESRSVTSGLGSAWPNIVRDGHTHNTTARNDMDIREDYGTTRRDNAVGVGGVSSDQQELLLFTKEGKMICNQMVYVVEVQEWEGQNLFNQNQLILA